MNELNFTGKPKGRAATRRRLSPEDRRNEILDAAARIIVDEGVSAVSMERVAREANASKPLVYAYFDNRQNLLSSLLMREYPAFQGERVVTSDDEPFDALLRRTTLEFIDRYVANGVLIQRLLAEPAVAEETLHRQKMGRNATAQFFAERINQAYGVPLEKGHLAAELLMGVTNVAARMLMQGDVEHDAIVDLTVEIIDGAARSLNKSAAARC